MRAPVLACLLLVLPALFGCNRRPAHNASPAATDGLPDDPVRVLKSNGVEPYPGAKPVSGISAARLEIPEGTAHATAWHTPDAPAQVIAFYVKHLADPVVEEKQKQMVVGRNRAGNSVTVVAAPEEGRTRITITVR